METESPKLKLLEAYDFTQATEADLECLTDFCVAHFARLEPHSKAIDIDGKVVRPLHRYIVAKCLHFPHSIKVIERSSGTIVGLRMMSVSHRDESLNWEPYEMDIIDFPENAKELVELILQTEELLWDNIDPNITKILQRDISLILPEHSRRGIARHIAELGLDFDQLRKDGVHGIGSTAFSVASQKLLFSMGFKCVAIPVYSWKNKLTDGTKTAMALFKDIRL